MKNSSFLQALCPPNLAGRRSPHDLHWPWEIWPQLPCGVCTEMLHLSVLVTCSLGCSILRFILKKKTVLYMIRLILVEWQNLLNQACHLLFLTLGNNGVQWRKSWCRHLRSGSVGQLVWKGVKVSHKHRETSRCHFVHVCSLENEEPDSEKSRWKNTRFVFVYCLSVINGYVKRKHPRIWF